MSKGDERSSVFRTTKVRTAIKGDSSWIQRRRDSEPEEEEKPWMAEVRASRLNGAPRETSPVSSPTSKTPPHTDTTQSPKAPTSGYLIRGVFKKTDTKPASSTPTNGYSAPTTTFTKKPSEGYKKIAPHTVRSTTEPTVQSEPQLSPEEVEKRTEAASSVLKTKAARQRSYVLSAAKKYESTSQPEDPPESTTSFVAKRVVISDDEDTTPADTPKEPVSAPPAPVPVSEPEPAPQPSVKEETPVVTPEPPVLTPEPLIVSPESPVVTPEPEPQEAVAEPTDEQSADSLSALSDTLISFNTEPTSPKEEQKAAPVVDLISSPVKESITHTKPVWAEETQTVETSVDPEPTPEPSDLDNDDLIALAQSGEEVEDSPPSTPQAWSEDLLSGPVSSPVQPEKTTGALNLLADDVIPIDTRRTSLSTDDILSPTETITITTKTTVIEDSNSTDPESPKTVTTTVIDDSSPDPFDPIPKETTPVKSPVELFDPLVLGTKSSSPDPVSPSSPDNSLPSDALVSLADDVIPIDTGARSISNRNWAHSWDMPTHDAPESEEEQEEQVEEAAGDDESFTVKFEKKSTDNDSPWDRWTSPTVYSTKPEESQFDTEDQESTSSDPESKKGIVLLKQYVDDASDNQTSHPPTHDYRRSGDMTACTYCGELVGSDAKITIEHLNISCHPSCFKCGICSKPMGDLLFSMFLHSGTVHCEDCYANVI